jgi:hypothetical protein
MQLVPLQRGNGAGAGAGAVAEDDHWADHGKRLYKAVIRAGRQLSKTPVDVAAEVEVFPEYPHRPPVFTLTLTRGIQPKPLPPSALEVEGAAGAGKGAGKGGLVLAVSDGGDGGFGDVGDALNDLRLMEEEVNVRSLSLVPAGAENETLGYQVVRLMQALDAAAACERWVGLALFTKLFCSQITR